MTNFKRLLMFISYQFLLLMSLDQNQKNNPDNNQTGTSFNQIRLNAQMLRMKTFQQLKQIETIWDLEQQDLCQLFNNYDAMPYSKIDTRLLFKKAHVRLIRNENKIYFGEIANKKKQGLGITICRSGKIYQGRYHNNVKTGEGCQIYQNGNIYIGSFLQNKKHGYGQFYWFNLSREIVIKDNQQNYDVQHYVGDWWGGLPDGQGIHTKINGDVYQGKFKNGLKQGYGIQNFANGDEYRGQYINGLMEGYGQYFWANGDTYKGDYKQGYKNGYGIFRKAADKQIYKGHFLLDMRHGYGISQWDSGYKYKGSFFKDKRQGDGQLHLNDQLIYKGIWIKGQASEGNLFDDRQNPEFAETMKKTKKSRSILKNSRTDEKIFTCQTNNFSQEQSNYFLKQNLTKTSSKKKHSNYFNRNQFEPRQSKSFVVTFKHIEQKRTPPKKSCHENCIPNYQYGKMPKPDWVHPKPHQRTALTPPKNQKRYHY